ncbi:MAG: biofilm protein TabA [Epulopiscium sp.]|jgi:YhcH/YjgK/YiaL family protein|nr:biofilm protein TabA [Candidatus Epulonipiscium sp.]
MIYGDIKNTDYIDKVYPLPLVKAINYLKNTDFSSIKAGKYEIEGQDIYAQVIDTTTKEKSKAKPETHKKYVDVQFLIEGKEIIGFARKSDSNKVVEDLLEQKDVIFYENAENESELVMAPGNFAVFFPDDVHRPACNCGGEHSIRKVIVKVSVELFK